MPHHSRYPNLHQLIGESVNQLSADVAQRVENLLCRSCGLMPILEAQRDVDDITAGAAQRAGLKARRAGTLSDLRHTVSGITVLTRMMHAAHIARTRGGPLQAVPPDAVEGLLLAARELTCYVQQQLQVERARDAATLQ
jgi:hypothetical protein